MSNNIKPAMPTVGTFKSKPASIPLNSAGPPAPPVVPVAVVSPVGY
jgi:hypothetical protein